MGKIRLPQLNRGCRTLVNLLLAAVLVLFLWGSVGFPLPTLELRFCRAEQTNWVGPSRIVSIFQAEGNDRLAAAVYQDKILLWRDGGSSFQYWPRQDGPSVLPVYDDRLSQETVWILAVEEPEGAASARLTARAECWMAITRTGSSSTRTSYAVDLDSGDWQPGDYPIHHQVEFTAEAERPEAQGGFLFPIYAQEPDSERNLTDADRRLLRILGQWESYLHPAQQVGAVCSLHVDFFDESGALIGQADLSTPD